MLRVLSFLTLAQLTTAAAVYAMPRSSPRSSNNPPAVTTPAPTPIPQRQAEIIYPQDVRPLPGQLDNIPVFNSNSPEVVQTEGILLSTFPPDGMQTPTAHLNHPLEGRFDVFAHHIARGIDANDNRTLFMGVLLYNPGDAPVTIDLLQAVSYLSQDAPFHELPAYVANPTGAVFAGPGSRTSNDILRGQRQSHWPAQIVIPPQESRMLMNLPIPLRQLTVATNGTLPPGYTIPTPNSQGGVATNYPGANPDGEIVPVNTRRRTQTVVNDDRPLPINGRTVLAQLSSGGPVYVASLAMFAPRTASGLERVPLLEEWQNLLVSGGLAGPRDRTPTPPETRAFLRFFYGRVSGVAQGSAWDATATDSPEVDHLSIPNAGEAFSYVISTVDHNTFGTGQIQSAPMLVRYPDTAYRAHGNYGVRYNIALPLYNSTDATQTVSLKIQTPLQDEAATDNLRFHNPPDDQIFFRGTVQLRFTDDFGIPQTRYVHLVQRRGQEGESLLRLTLPRGDRRLVEVQLVYPPDATPPQVLTVQTVDNSSVVQVRPETGSH
jgi:hypothetical protein